jgi:hypothetical protein
MAFGPFLIYKYFGKYSYFILGVSGVITINGLSTIKIVSLSIPIKFSNSSKRAKFYALAFAKTFLYTSLKFGIFLLFSKI